MHHLALTTDEKKNLDLKSKIQGWGADLDPSVRPGVPRDKAPMLGADALYPDSIPQQVPEIKIHQSIEHERLTPVFGTAAPPHGLSGMIRDKAYGFGEGQLTHWLMLLVADRVDVVEGVISDLKRGHVPNVFEEMGLRSEFRYNRQGLLKKFAIVGASAVAVGALISFSRKKVN